MRATINAYLHIISLFVLAAMFSSCDSGVTDSTDILSENVGPANASEATATFDVENDSYSAASGKITVEYLGEEVEINYDYDWTPLDVAATLSQAIKLDDDIEILATHDYGFEPTVTVRERRDEAQYNGNPVYLSDSNSTNHIKLSDSVIYLAGGTD